MSFRPCQETEQSTGNLWPMMPVKNVFIWRSQGTWTPVATSIGRSLPGVCLLHHCINLAVLGGNDPHSYGVTSRRASMNTLRPTILKNTKGTIMHLCLPRGTSPSRACTVIITRWSTATPDCSCFMLLDLTNPRRYCHHPSRLVV